jgi:hypothetical protein
MAEKNILNTDDIQKIQHIVSEGWNNVNDNLNLDLDEDQLRQLKATSSNAYVEMTEEFLRQHRR